MGGALCGWREVGRGFAGFGGWSNYVEQGVERRWMLGTRMDLWGVCSCFSCLGLRVSIYVLLVQ